MELGGGGFFLDSPGRGLLNRDRESAGQDY